MTEKLQLTKSDRKKVWWRSTFLQGSWNFERMQNLGWAYTLIPAIKKLYTKKEDQIAALERHLEFFNTHPYVAAPVMGVTLALEEERANGVEPLEFPLLALLVSGGHTELVYVSEAGDYKIVGETRDDAVGEAYDKVGRVMGLTYPAGREIDELAHQGQDIYDFPRAMIKEDNLEFSFSGLKSAFINLHHNAEQKGESLSTEDLCASFQAAVMDILMAKTKKALEKYPVKILVVAGGVAANKGLRERLAAEITDVKVIIPPLRLCGDNAGMIAYASVSEWNKENFAGWDLNAKPSLAFDTME